MEYDIGIMPADLMRSIIQLHFSWTTACSTALTCKYWYKTLKKFIEHPSVSINIRQYYGEVMLIHRGRLYRIYRPELDKNSYKYIETEFRSHRDMVLFMEQLDDVLKGKIVVDEPEIQTKPSTKKRKLSLLTEEFAGTVVNITSIDGVAARWTSHQSHPNSMQLEILKQLYLLIAATIDKATIPINDTRGELLFIRQGFDQSEAKSVFYLDVEGNATWTSRRISITTRCNRDTFKTLRDILLSDKKHKIGIEHDEFAGSQAWFEAFYTTSDNITYQIQHGVNKSNPHRDKVFKQFIKEFIPILHTDSDALIKFYSRFHTDITTPQPCPWHQALKPPQTNLKVFTNNQVVPIQRIEMHSNAMNPKKSKRCPAISYLTICLHSNGICDVNFLEPGSNASYYIDLKMIGEMLQKLVEMQSDSKVKTANKTFIIEPIGEARHMVVSAQPRAYQFTSEQFEFLWEWIVKNILTEPRPAVLK